MNKRVILSLGLAVLLSSSLFAGNMGNNRDDRGTCNSMGYDKNGGNRFISLVNKLDLNDEQKKKISSIMQEKMKSMPNPSDAFSDKEFDKALFIKIQKEKMESRVERKADMMEAVYAVLTPTQKQQLKKMMDQKSAMRKESCKNSLN